MRTGLWLIYILIGGYVLGVQNLSAGAAYAVGVLFASVAMTIARNAEKKHEIFIDKHTANMVE